jgi:DNA-binding NarL/FixJ family response regulator
MEANCLQPGTVGNTEMRPKVLVISEIRLLAEGLAQALGRDERVAVSSFCTDLQEGLLRAADLRPELVLLDAALPDGPRSVGRILAVEPRAKVAVFAVTETSDNVIAWARAGVAGYIPRTVALTEIVAHLASILRGEQTSSAEVTASLLRRLSRPAGLCNDPGDAELMLTLTAREMQIVELLAAGLSNKDIARRLNIGVGTTKSHVHNVLGKLRVQRRGQAALHARGVHRPSALSLATPPGP